MKNLKCESCGSNMVIDPNNKDYAICEYCGSRVKLSQDVNLNINIDDDIKKGVKTGGKIIAGISIAHLITFILIFLVILGLVLFITFKTFSNIDKNKKDNSVNNSQLNKNDSDVDYNKIKDKFNKNSFNSSFELYSGTQSVFFIESLLNEVITNNKKNSDHIITIVYKETSTSNPDEITKLKQSMKNKQYEVILDYDNDGYINKITLKDIK